MKNTGKQFFSESDITLLSEIEIEFDLETKSVEYCPVEILFKSNIRELPDEIMMEYQNDLVQLSIDKYIFIGNVAKIYPLRFSISSMDKKPLSIKE